MYLSLVYKKRTSAGEYNQASISLDPNADTFRFASLTVYFEAYSTEVICLRTGVEDSEFLLSNIR